ncbi:hypothetical protein ACOQFO_05415 [Ureibacillus sp. MALMAid1270]|uniref:hypothetical protein n=1 Tax=Ureibacillus sp. MALMAid1270 TaxID=3411629 RepID=UPI003BA66179
MYDSDKQLYYLETTNKNDVFYVSKYIQKIREIIKTQGKNGSYSISAQNPYLIIKNIFNSSPELAEINMVRNTITTCVDSLLADNLSYPDKISATQLIIFIKTKFNLVQYDYSSLYFRLKEKENFLQLGIDDLLQKHSRLTLKFNFRMLEMILGELENVELIEILSEINNEDDFEKIQCLKAIINAINNNNFQGLDYGIQNILIQFVFGLKDHNNQDIRYLVVRILLKMITYKNKRAILTQLSKSMDYDNVYIKNLIISNLDLLNIIDNDVAQLMIKKALVDNHYFVRVRAHEFLMNNPEIHVN